MLPPAPPPGARACSVPKTLSCHRGSSIIPKHIPTHALQCIHCTHTYTYTQRKQRPRCGWFELGVYHAAQRSIISICSHGEQQRREDMGCSAQGVQLPVPHIHRPCISNDVQLNSFSVAAFGSIHKTRYPSSCDAASRLRLQKPTAPSAPQTTVATPCSIPPPHPSPAN
jgi:hypothetical protein